MADEQVDIRLGDAAAAQLDRLLDEWAENVFLHIEQREPIAAEGVIILAEDLGYRWWQQLFDGFPFKDINRYHRTAS